MLENLRNGSLMVNPMGSESVSKSPKKKQIQGVLGGRSQHAKTYEPRKKKTYILLSIHHTGCLMGIIIMVY